MRRRALRLSPLLLSLLLLPGLADAAAVKIWVSDTAADFSTGEARGVSVTADGSLLPGKSLSRVDGVAEAVLFTAVQGKSGELYVGHRRLRADPADLGGRQGRDVRDARRRRK